MSWTEEEQAAMQVVSRLTKEGRLDEFLVAAAVQKPVASPEPTDLPIHKLEVLEVPREVRQRLTTYLRRRLRFPLQDAAKVGAGDMIMDKVAFWQAKDVLSDLETMGVKAHIVDS